MTPTDTVCAGNLPLVHGIACVSMVVIFPCHLESFGAVLPRYPLGERWGAGGSTVFL